MPSTHTIPAHTRRVCVPCEHHKCIGTLHVRVGAGGWREYACTHPGAYDPLLEGCTPEQARIIGQLNAMEKEGRYIGKTDNQPDWCPLLREEIQPHENIRTNL